MHLMSMRTCVCTDKHDGQNELKVWLGEQLNNFWFVVGDSHPKHANADDRSLVAVWELFHERSSI